MGVEALATLDKLWTALEALRVESLPVNSLDLFLCTAREELSLT